LTLAGCGLAPAERVRRRPDFERAYNTGARVHGKFMTLFVVANGAAAPRFGVAATRKLGSAVERNRAKRISREIFRRHKVTAGLDIVVVPRREMLDASFATLESDYLSVLERRTHARPRPPRREVRGGGAARAHPRV
jgi:ribonuclease P protein component